MDDDITKINSAFLGFTVGTARGNAGRCLAAVIVDGRMYEFQDDGNGGREINVVHGWNTESLIQLVTDVDERITLALTDRAPYEDFYEGAHFERHDNAGNLRYWREKKDVEAMQ